ncbi:MAG: hypothetical protein JJU03_07290 [Idiomarina sp.]|nr:hypothetical protein [Idiomarina sp.]
MWLANIVAKVPFKIRLAFALVVLVGLFILSGPVIFNHTGFFLVLLFLLFFDRILARTEHQVHHVEDPVAQVTLESGKLVVCGVAYPASKITRVALGSDGDKGYLQFPFNPKFKARLSFPANQVAPLSMHIKQLLPDVTLVE